MIADVQPIGDPGNREMQHFNGNSKLNPQKVIEIRRLRSEGWSYPRLARQFHVGENQIARICKGTAWAHVTQGQEILTDGEMELRQLTAPQPSQEEIEASFQRLQGMLKKQEQEPKEDIYAKYRVPGQQQQQVNATPTTSDMSQHEVVEQQQAMVNAEQLLETLKDEQQRATDTRDPRTGQSEEIRGDGQEQQYGPQALG